MKKIYIILTIFALNIAGLVWCFSDTQVIKRQTKELADSLTISSTDTKTTRGLKNQKLTALLSQELECSINIKDYIYEFDKDTLAAAHLALLSYGDSSSAKVSELTLTFESDTTAVTSTKLELSASQKGGKSHHETCDAQIIWKKNPDKHWKIKKIVLNGNKE